MMARLLTMREAVKAYGLCAKTLAKLAAKGEVDGRKYGRVWRFAPPPSR